MEDILASIKKVIAEEKGLRSGATAPAPRDKGSLSEARESDPEFSPESGDDDVLELSDRLAPPTDLGPPLIDDQVAGHSRQALEQLQTVAASIPAAPPTNPLEDMVRELLRPILKQWLDEHLPAMVDEHVKREISRITGRPL